MKSNCHAQPKFIDCYKKNSDYQDNYIKGDFYPKTDQKLKRQISHVHRVSGYISQILICRQHIFVLHNPVRDYHKSECTIGKSGNPRIDKHLHIQNTKTKNSIHRALEKERLRYLRIFKEFLSNYPHIRRYMGSRADVYISLLGLVSTAYCTLASRIEISDIIVEI